MCLLQREASRWLDREHCECPTLNPASLFLWAVLTLRTILIKGSILTMGKRHLQQAKHTALTFDRTGWGKKHKDNAIKCSVQSETSRGERKQTVFFRCQQWHSRSGPGLLTPKLSSFWEQSRANHFTRYIVSGTEKVSGERHASQRLSGQGHTAVCQARVSPVPQEHAPWLTSNTQDCRNLSQLPHLESVGFHFPHPSDQGEAMLALTHLTFLFIWRFHSCCYKWTFFF